MKYQFPEGFLWGASTSAHQVEGNDQGALFEAYEKQGQFVRVENAHSDTTNDWTEWEKKNAPILARETQSKFGHLPIWKEIVAEATFPKNYISGAAADHYHKYAEDFNLAKSLGHNAHRLSIEWSRIEPEEGKFNQDAIEHYRNVLKALRERGIEPFVTLWHWPLPLWVAKNGGWKNKKTVEHFARYATRITAEYSSLVKFWITINEPEIFSSNSYLKGNWPPQEKSIFSFFSVMDTLTKAHISSYRRMKEINPEAQVGIAKNNIWFEPANILNSPISLISSWFWDRLFLNHIKDHQDFIGLNHYFHNRINFGFNKNKNERISDMGWELCPEAMYHCLKELKRYGKPIYITENGLADRNDKYRGWFLKETLKQVHRATSEGADVRGYLHWSLLDNFEWDKGFWPRFGLIEVDYKTFSRKPRPSAYTYKKIIEDSGFDE